jgi:iron(III) transport system substrate-binding protein
VSLSLIARAAAQDAPAVQQATGAEKTRIQELIRVAAQEGELDYLDTVIQPETNDTLAAAFRKRYGLPTGFKVNYTLLTPGNLITRLEQEIRAKRLTADVAAVGSPVWAAQQTRQGAVMAYDTPEYANYSKSFQLGLGMKGYFAFNGGYTFVVMWNSENLKFKGTSWRDVIAAVPPGRISYGDCSKSDSALGTYMGLRKVLDREFFESLARLRPVFLYKAELFASRLVTGEDLMTAMGLPGRAYQSNKKGATLEILIPSEGVVLIPQSMFILQGAQHPASAKLWLDFVLSDEGQQIIVEREAMISGRDGFTSPLPKYAPSIGNLNVIAMNWGSISIADLQSAREECSAIFHP